MPNNYDLSIDTPFFTKGSSPLVKFVLCALISLSLMIIDHKFDFLSYIRNYVASVMYPTQQAIAIVPQTINKINSYSRNHIEITAENQNLHEQLTHSSLNAYQASKLYKENTQLKNLLDIKQTSSIPLLATEILYSSNNPFIHRLIINKGVSHNVQVGQALINEYGVLGQVTRVFNDYSEVTMISENQIMVPVQNSRNGIKGIASGSNSNILLKFIPYSSDIKIGDILITSGLDGVYPEGLAVAKVSKINGKTADGFLNIECTPTSNIVDKPYAMIILNKPLNIELIQSIDKESTKANTQENSSQSTKSFYDKKTKNKD
ncbi:MAG: Rod shape-determining protein MreC [Pseudomonadota bacterium]|jgi:rod shape-determining protein MreC